MSKEYYQNFNYQSEYESPKPRRRRRRRDVSRDDRDEDIRYSRRRGPVIGQAPNPDFDRVKPKIDNNTIKS